MCLQGVMLQTNFLLITLEFDVGLNVVIQCDQVANHQPKKIQ